MTRGWAAEQMERQQPGGRYLDTSTRTNTKGRPVREEEGGMIKVLWKGRESQVSREREGEKEAVLDSRHHHSVNLRNHARCFEVGCVPPSPLHGGALQRTGLFRRLTILPPSPINILTGDSKSRALGETRRYKGETSSSSDSGKASRSPCVSTSSRSQKQKSNWRERD